MTTIIRHHQVVGLQLIKTDQEDRRCAKPAERLVTLYRIVRKTEAWDILSIGIALQTCPSTLFAQDVMLTTLRILILRVMSNGSISQTVQSQHAVSGHLALETLYGPKRFKPAISAHFALSWKRV